MDKKVMVWDFEMKAKLAIFTDPKIQFFNVRIRTDLRKVYAGGRGSFVIKCWNFVSEDEKHATKTAPVVHNLSRYIRENDPESQTSIYAMKFLGTGFPESFLRFTQVPTENPIGVELKI